MKIVVVGPGAIGTLYAALLSKTKSGHDVWMLDKNPQRARRLNSSGIEVEGISNFKTRIKATSSVKDIDKCNLIIIAVKSYDTKLAVNSIKPLLSEDAKVLTLQNGVGNLEIVNELVPQENTIGGVTELGATLISQGRVKYAGSGETTIGRPDGKIFGDLRSIAYALNEAKIKTKMSRDIKSAIWSKLVVSSGINAIAAVTKLTNGQLIRFDGAKEILREAVLEASKVAKRKKIKLIFDDPIQKVESVCVATSLNICSMLQDVINKRPTEVDSINGAISRHGKSTNVKTPVNDILFSLVKTIESSYDTSMGTPCSTKK